MPVLTSTDVDGNPDAPVHQRLTDSVRRLRVPPLERHDNTVRRTPPSLTECIAEERAPTLSSSAEIMPGYRRQIDITVIAGRVAYTAIPPPAEERSCLTTSTRQQSSTQLPNNSLISSPMLIGCRSTVLMRDPA